MKQYCLVSIAAVLSATAATDTDPLALAGLLFVAAFWFLDAQYLAQERWFRTLGCAVTGRENGRSTRRNTHTNCAFFITGIMRNITSVRTHLA